MIGRFCLVTQLLETQTRADSIWADTVDAKGKALIARERLAQLVGRSADQLSQVVDNIALMINVSDVESAANLAVDLDPATAAAREAVSAAKKAVARGERHMVAGGRFCIYLSILGCWF